MRNLRLFLRYARLNLMSAAEYRASFLGAALGMLLNNSTFVFFWWVAFGYAGESIGGYSFDDVMFIWAASSTAYGLAHVFFDGVRGLSRTIVQGELDIFLLQPKPPLLSLACSKTDFTSWGDLLYGFVLMALTGQNGAACPHMEQSAPVLYDRFIVLSVHCAPAEILRREDSESSDLRSGISA